MLVPLSLALALAAEIPLRRITYTAEVTGPLADVVVQQVFRNESDTFVDATYVFPLHERASVDGMVMRVGDREIVGMVKERAAARRAFDAAVEAGHAAALTEQERPNVFTQSVGNLPPGQDITVTMHLVVPVAYVDGEYELVFPLTVGPRFSPAGVEDAERVTPPVARGDTGVRADVDVAIEAGAELLDVGSPTHAGRVVRDATGATASFDDLVPSRDLVLRWSYGVDEPQAVALRQGEFILVAMEPPYAPPREAIVPREITWVVDTSCSMSGAPLDLARRAMDEAFASMDARDSFMVMDFNSAVSSLSDVPLSATPENIDRGIAYVAAFQGEGGTDMLQGITAALARRGDGTRERYVAVLTDGYIGNEREILAAIEDQAGDVHVYAFGLGSGVNRFLLDEMARAGRGRHFVATLDEDAADPVAAFLDGLDEPVLSGIEIDFGGAGVDVAYPGRVPDLVAGQPLFVVARATMSSDDPVIVRGRLGDGFFEQEIPVLAAGEGHALGSTWARARIADLERAQAWGEVPEVREEILATALEHGILSRYTSMLAVDRVIVNRDGARVAVDVPSIIPDGVDFDSAVSREWTPPGDPLLTVDAPSDARAVLAVYPWEEVVQLRWDGLRHRWFHRFLVPREVPDGDVEVLLYVVSADGTLERRVQVIHVDGHAPELRVEVAVLGDRTLVTVTPAEPLRSIVVQPVGDPSHRVRREIGADEDALSFTLELDGAFPAVEVVAKDRAMNSIVVQASAREPR